MKTNSIARIISIIIFGALIGCAVHMDHLKRGQMKREDFLAKQGERFDRHFAKPDPIVIELFLGVLTAGVALGAYELVALSLTKIVSRGQ